MTIREFRIQDSVYGYEKKSNRAVSITEYEQGKIVLKSRPRAIFVELTQNCNLHCPMCRKRLAYDPKKNMSFELFKLIADELFPYAELVDLRGYGESTVLKQLPHFLEYAARYECQLKLFTNLAVASDKVWQSLVQYGVTLAVSFDSASKMNFERIRAGAKFETVISNLKKLQHWYQVYGYPMNEHVYFSTTVQKQNLYELVDILKVMSDFGLNLIKLFPICCGEYDFGSLTDYKEDIREILLQAQLFARSHRISLELGESLHPLLTVPEKVIEKCTHPWTHLVIDYQGKIGFCDNLIPISNDLIMGNFRAKHFQSIWNGELYQKLRREHKQGKKGLEYFKICGMCYQYRYNEIEHMFIPSQSKKIVSSDCSENLTSVQ